MPKYDRNPRESIETGVDPDTSDKKPKLLLNSDPDDELESVMEVTPFASPSPTYVPVPSGVGLIPSPAGIPPPEPGDLAKAIARMKNSSPMVLPSPVTFSKPKEVPPPPKTSRFRWRKK